MDKESYPGGQSSQFFRPFFAESLYRTFGPHHGAKQNKITSGDNYGRSAIANKTLTCGQV